MRRVDTRYEKFAETFLKTRPIRREFVWGHTGVVRYVGNLNLARKMAEHLMAAQKPGGWWVHRFDQPVEEWGVGTKGTALWCWLVYELHRHTDDPRHLSAARLALGWLLDEQYFGEDQYARGGHVTVSPHSAVGYRPWFRVTCTYGSAFYGLALLQELRVQDSTLRSASATRP